MANIITHLDGNVTKFGEMSIRKKKPFLTQIYHHAKENNEMILANAQIYNKCI